MKASTSLRNSAHEGHAAPPDGPALAGDADFDASGTLIQSMHAGTYPVEPARNAQEAATRRDRAIAPEPVRESSRPPAQWPAHETHVAPDPRSGQGRRWLDTGEPATAQPEADEDWDATGSLVAPLGFAIDELASLVDLTRSAGAPPPAPPQVRDSPDVAIAAIEQNALAMAVWDTDGRAVSINAAFARLTGHGTGDFGRWDLRLLASGRYDADFFAALWRSVEADGQWRGELWIRTAGGREIPCLAGLCALREAGTVRRYCAVLADLTARRSAHDEPSGPLRLAYEDALTGLATRSLLIERLGQAVSSARRAREGVALLFVDLDRFKEINDSFGRSAGDEVLRLTGQRLSGCVREQDTVARLGTDEFAVVLPGIGDGRQAMTVVRKIGAALSQPVALGGRKHKLTASIGISLFPEDGTDAQTLIQHAETAMFGAKARGRNSYAFYRQRMTEDVQQRLMMEASLAQALERNELSVVFQPQIDVASGAITGAESLLRWQHPEHGAVPPDRFIPLAEETGLIRPIGSWVLGKMCAQLKAWRDEGLGPLRLAVNVSPQQISRRKYSDELLAILSAQWVPDAGMELDIEITESSLQTSDDAMAAAGLLKSAGATIAIDDFGTGYSSLMTLRRLPVDRLKLDRSFMDGVTSDPGTARLAAGAIAMGRTLGLRVLAEGVEDEAQLEFLRWQGCHEAQGFLFGQPMSATEFRELLLRTRAGR